MKLDIMDFAGFDRLTMLIQIVLWSALAVVAIYGIVMSVSALHATPIGGFALIAAVALGITALLIHET